MAPVFDPTYTRPARTIGGVGSATASGVLREARVLACTLPEVEGALPAGATVKVTLTTKDGKKLAFDAVAWPFPGGGNEPYVDKTGMGTATPAMSTTR